jgi:hypothetical protein
MRRRFMLAIVLFVLIWPMAHAGLVARYRIDAWEFFGWSMYALPAARVQVRVEVEREGEMQRLRARGVMRQRVKRFARESTALGRFAPTAPLAQEILNADDTIDAVLIVTREITLDPESTLLFAHDEQHRHERTVAPSDGS